MSKHPNPKSLPASDEFLKKFYYRLIEHFQKVIEGYKDSEHYKSLTGEPLSLVNEAVEYQLGALALLKEIGMPVSQFLDLLNADDEESDEEGDSEKGSSEKEEDQDEESDQGIADKFFNLIKQIGEKVDKIWHLFALDKMEHNEQISNEMVTSILDVMESIKKTLDDGKDSNFNGTDNEGELYLPLLAKFHGSFSDTDKADVSIISVGCCGDGDQQVYPWVYDYAKQNPDKKVVIDLFDPTHEVDGVQFINEKNTAQWDHNVNEKSYTHNQYDITVNVHRSFPLEEFGAPLAGPVFRPYFIEAVKKHLEIGKKVIISQHTGGAVIDKIFVETCSEIKQEMPHLLKNLVVFGQNFVHSNIGQGVIGRVGVMNKLIPSETIFIQEEGEALYLEEFTQETHSGWDWQQFESTIIGDAS